MQVSLPLHEITLNEDASPKKSCKISIERMDDSPKSPLKVLLPQKKKPSLILDKDLAELSVSEDCDSSESGRDDSPAGSPMSEIERSFKDKI